MKANILAGVILSALVGAIVTHYQTRQRSRLAAEDRRGQRGTFLVTPPKSAVM